MMFLAFVPVTNGGIRINTNQAPGARAISVLQRPLITDKFYLPPSYTELVFSATEVITLRTNLLEARDVAFSPYLPSEPLPNFDRYQPIGPDGCDGGGVRIIVQQATGNTRVVAFSMANHAGCKKEVVTIGPGTQRALAAYHVPFAYAGCTMGLDQINAVLAAL